MIILDLLFFINDFLFAESAKDLFEIYIDIIFLLSVYSAIYVFKTAKEAIDEIKNFVFSSLLSFKKFMNDSIDRIVDNLL